MRVKVTNESIILAFICIADMLVTLYYVVSGLAIEANPVMAAAFDHSPQMFVIIKTLSFVPFIVAAELYYKHNPSFVKLISRAAIGVYLALYVVLTIGLNI